MVKMKDKEIRDLIMIIVAMLAFTVDVMGMALQIHLLPYWMLRIIYISVLAMNTYSNAITDMKHRKTILRHEIQRSRAEATERFVEEYAKFVNEVHK